MASKRFDRWKYMEEWLQRNIMPGVDYTLRLEKDVVHYEPGEAEPYIYDEFVVEWSV
jgi:hypothetical protein